MSDVWNSDSCCSFATLSDSPKLLLSFLLGIVISWTVVMWFKLDRSSKPEPRSNRVTDGDSGHCELPHCLRCCSITRRNVESNILEKWKLYLQHTGEEQHLKPVNEAVLSFVATRPASEKDKQLESSQNPTVFSVPRLHSQPWWDYFGSTSYEHDLKLLKSRAEAIKKEFLQMDRKYSMKDDLFSDWIVNVESQWRMCHLINQGTYVKDICDQCPGTYQVLRQLKNCMDGCIFGYASFSVVEARASLLSHTGPTNVRLRCHLGIVLPVIIRT